MALNPPNFSRLRSSLGRGRSSPVSGDTDALLTRLDGSDEKHTFIIKVLFFIGAAILAGWIYFDAKIERKLDYLNLRIDKIREEKDMIEKKMVLIPKPVSTNCPTAPSSPPSQSQNTASE